ncbi:glycosyltransferase [Bifidobacterium cebidarum]|uniref:Multidrug MFS transporter n=1 Tax=Bifidobacterium cebidarum TaxID=2650773 RepID=A0A6I1GF13_9BIFI|nr:glycosyltransferase [Bifidobacterium cebidarum]KAB7788127.1 multidrug MFS transporter [Bifidobacterium cebidarum]
MIFVTVGTHEQPFNRLIRAVDELKGEGVIDEPVFMQTGYSTYEPKHCEWKKFLPYDEMQQKVDEAHIVISHGGPSSFLMPLKEGKIPIVVPRKVEFNEHINNHQVDFIEAVTKRFNNIIPIYNIKDIYSAIQNYDQIARSIQVNTISNNALFNERLEVIVKKLLH